MEKVLCFVAFGLLLASPVQQSTGADRAFPIDRVSAGGLMLLDRKGDLVQPPRVAPTKATADESLSAGLDPRVGPNVRLGDDPPALPASMRAQAEPHLVRDVHDPDFLVGTFQEGRFTDGGAVDCGYSISRDGGLTWSRELIPNLTTASGGPFFRATDPVAGIDLDGNVYLNMLGSVDTAFDISALLISRSMDGGRTFQSPIEIARSPSSGAFIDKNWMVINTFTNTPTANRIVCTFTRFDANGSPICITYSDDHGATWTPWKYATAVPIDTQGSQPVFLPNGHLAMIYWNFAYSVPVYYSLEVLVSTNGGSTFTASNQVAKVAQYDVPGIRDGSFLPSATGNRVDNSLYVAYQGITNGVGKILFTKSPNEGVTWTKPQVVNDSPAGTAVFNPAIAVSPDGQVVTIIFYDGRNNAGNANLFNIYLAQSFDGGATWGPNVRVTSRSTDASLAPMTGSGYMLGDYQGLAPGQPPAIPAVGLFIDTRTGSPDPFIARVGLSSKVTFPSWRTARLSYRQVLEPAVSAPEADADGDSYPNAVEYAFGMNPIAKDTPVYGYAITNSLSSRTIVATHERLQNASDLKVDWLTSTNLIQWTKLPDGVESFQQSTNSQMIRSTAVFSSTNSPMEFFRLGVELLPQ